ncbi:hypothetical protein JCM6882_001657 [Rhodosporidiobolus microsporus]
MLTSFLKLAAVASLAGAVVAQSCKVDSGNGVHVPGAVPVSDVEPLQHRLAFAGDGMTISWNTFAKLDAPTVRYGFSPDKLEFQATTNLSTTFPTSRTWNNHVKLHNLEPGTTYYYQVSHTNIGNSAYLPTFKFKSAAAPGSEEPLKIAVVGDLGLMGEDGLSTRYGPFGGIEHAVLDANETNTIQSLLAMKDTYSALLHYADYFLRESVQGYFGTDNSSTQPTREMVAKKYESLSEQFFDQMRPISAEKPWMVAPGNHEANCDNGGYTDKRAAIQYTDDWCLPGQTNFTWFLEHFKMPSYESGGRGSMWWSQTVGMAHIISLNTETDLGADLVGPIENSTNNVNGPFGAPNEQVEWLKADLEKVDRSVTPWVIVQLHRPWYTSMSPPAWPAWQQAFEQIFMDYGVDIYFTGHVHTYERFLPMFNGTIDPAGYNNPRAPVPILLGNGGHYDGLDEFEGPERANGTAFATDQEYGWTHLTLHNRTHLELRSIAARNSSVIDSVVLYKEHDYPSKKYCGKFKC